MKGPAALASYHIGGRASGEGTGRGRSYGTPLRLVDRKGGDAPFLSASRGLLGIC